MQRGFHQTPRNRKPPLGLLLRLAFAALMLVSCSTLYSPSFSRQAQETEIPVLSSTVLLPTATARILEDAYGSKSEMSSPTAGLPVPILEPTVPTPGPQPPPEPLPQAEEEQIYGAGEPAGCRSSADQEALPDISAMLAYAEDLLNLPGSMTRWLLPNSYNAYTKEFDYHPSDAITISVDRVENEFLIQNMLNALQVAGFVSWLRRTGQQKLHILAIPLRSPGVMQSAWAPYIQAYWLDRSSLPSGDPQVLSALKLPPCAWMVEAGFAPQVDETWWDADIHAWPEYSAVSAAYLAPSPEDASRIAREINWLGDRFREGPDTMCGPLAWSILADAGAFPPGWGGWSAGAKVFWLAKPSENGRPWSLFPKESYISRKFKVPLGTFDFRTFPLYSGDFIYTYSKRDGFDHMFVVTEVDRAGNVYTVSNLVKVEPERRTTIERLLLLNLYDPEVGIARNEWAEDRINGRTGHAGFEVFRWTWMEKDISGQPGHHTVQPGDTYGLIAARWKTPAAHIAKHNGDRMDSSLLVGQVIGIPPNSTPGISMRDDLIDPDSTWR